MVNLSNFHFVIFPECNYIVFAMAAPSIGSQLLPHSYYSTLSGGGEIAKWDIIFPVLLQLVRDGIG